MRKTILVILITGLLASCAALPQARPSPSLANQQAGVLTPAEKASQIEGRLVGDAGEATTVPDNGCSKIPPGEAVVLLRYERKLRRNLLVPVDPDTGQVVCGREPVHLPYPSDVLISPDGRMVVSLHLGNIGYRDSLALLDVQTWKEIPTEIKPRGYLSAFAFSPDARRFAMTYPEKSYTKAGEPAASELVLVETLTGKAAGSVRIPFTARKLIFTPDGSALVVYGGPSVQRDSTILQAEVALVQVDNAAIAWHLLLPDVAEGTYFLEHDGDDPPQGETQMAGVALAPDGKKLYLVHSEEDRLTTLNLEDQAVSTVEIHRQLSWIERLLSLTAEVAYAKVFNGSVREAVLSPDGKTLFAVGYGQNNEKDQNGDYQYEMVPTGLLVVDAATGAERGRLETDATIVEVTPGGRYLLLRGWSNANHTEVVDAATLEVVNRLSWQHAAVLPRFGAGPVFLAAEVDISETQVTRYDASTMSAINSWILDGFWAEEGFLPWPRTK